MERAVSHSPGVLVDGQPADADPEGDVLGHRHVVEQRVALEHEPDLAVLDRQIRRVQVCGRQRSRQPLLTRQMLVRCGVADGRMWLQVDGGSTSTHSSREQGRRFGGTCHEVQNSYRVGSARAATL